MAYDTRLPKDFETWNDLHDWILKHIPKEYNPDTRQLQTPEIIRMVEYGTDDSDEKVVPVLRAVTKTAITYSLIDVERRALAELKEQNALAQFSTEETLTILRALEQSRQYEEATYVDPLIERFHKIWTELRRRKAAQQRIKSNPY